ncbi:MAG: sulfatase/phosphatase domain-containing protein, partial [Candidatus Sumerlaeota bacterium]
VFDMLDVEIDPEISETLPGKSFLPLMQKKQDRIKDYVFIQWDDFGFCIRGEKWKLNWYDAYGEGELYDLQADPREKQNRFADPEVADVRDDLLKRLRDWREKYDPENLRAMPVPS